MRHSQPIREQALQQVNNKYVEHVEQMDNQTSDTEMNVFTVQGNEKTPLLQVNIFKENLDNPYS